MNAETDDDLDEREMAVALRRLTVDAARVGGQVALDSFGKPVRVNLKKDGSNVSEVDVAAERATIDCIRRQRPNDRCLGEEGVSDDRPNGGQHAVDEAELTWVIDPIDGTDNYIRGTPLFACSVAVLRSGVPIAGAIYDPCRGTMYSAEIGAGAWIDDRPIESAVERNNGKRPLEIIVVVSCVRHKIGRDLVRCVTKRHAVRNLGSDALNLALVATGGFDAAVMNECKLWDIAAGWLLVTEAGGRMTTLDGQPRFPIDVRNYRDEILPSLAGHPKVHAELLSYSANE